MKFSVSALSALLFLAVWISAGSTRAQAESTMNCPAGTYDMLDWMTLDSDLRGNHHLTGNANPMYTTISSGKFYWTKGGNGTPWDIQLYDSHYIYLWVTEYNWNNPNTYKKFTYNTNLPLAPRCAKAGFPGTTIKVPNTAYDTYTDCNHHYTQNLLKSINEIWGPYNMKFGGNLPANLQILVDSYRYNCNSNYQNCMDKEEYYLSKRYGLVQWVHSALVSGKYQVKQVTYFNTIVAGGTSPSFACF
jgi:hypothetical protein